MTHPTPREPGPGGTQPLELTVAAELRGNEFDLMARVPVRFVYDPADPYALQMYVYDHGNREWARWLAAREVFLVPALWGVALPGLDLQVSLVTLTRAKPGGPDREVPCLRVRLLETDRRTGAHTDYSVYLDIEVADVVRWFTTLTQVVKVGHEHKYMDMDSVIDRLLGRPRVGEV